MTIPLMNDAETWYLVFTRSRMEKTAVTQLGNQGYISFMPFIRSYKRRNNKLVQVVEPMFPRYLFVKLNTTTDHWRPIYSTRGVTCMVRFGLEHARVSQGLINQLQALGDEEHILDVTPLGPKPGDRVRIADGSFVGLEGILQARTGHERVRLLLELLGQTTIVELDEKDIDAL